MRCDSGRELIGETEVTNWPSYRIARLGLMRTFQLSRELGGLTVLENMLAAPAHQAGDSLVNVFLRPGLIRRQEREHAERRQAAAPHLALPLLPTLAAQLGKVDIRCNRHEGLGWYP